ncbi:MAG: DUF4861 domain-containing protein [Dysgonomonas sp.]|jgi:uncharacterized protein YcfL|uniref:DUF4861 domain-containing protein n=1 Tax=unclassified Dysgonomonas TaxID=2630389 RepID=UPI0025C41647|nr:MULTISPECIES: DUF4861 domain-containing protein [unclassified Dysgonomonas]MDR2003875.1 DUF4861 domain-containing protein [Prevotella sp.]HMM03308.1 DUF4861 domain-containing protein [Dysgonomonas sp.]
MKKILSFFLSVIFLLSCSSNKEMNITVENTSDFDRVADMVEIPLDSIKAKVKLTDSAVYVVKNSAGEIIPSQVTYDRKLIFQPELKAKESKSFIITTDTAQTYAAKTYGRFITERKDDFAWENDRVAFRIYGPALIETDGPSNGIDAWYKRTNNLIIDKWYKADLAGEASYHEDHGEGQDDYKVGRSLGAGAMAPYLNNKLWLNENFASEELLDNGPLRTTFKLTYKNLDVDGKSVAENRTISIDAGSQLSKIVQAYTIKEPMPVAAGIVKREKNDSIISSDKYVVYAEPKSDMVDNVYLALVFPQGIDKSIVDTYTIDNPKTKKKDTYSHVLAITTQQPNIPVTYYSGYGWSKFGFATVADFENYVKEFSEGLDNPLVVTYNK